MIRYFKKELNSRPVMGSNQRRINFEGLAGDSGVLAIDDSTSDGQQIAADLDAFAARRRGGIIPITAEEYEDLKKNHPPGSSKTRFDRNMQASPGSIRASPARHAERAEAKSSDTDLAVNSAVYAAPEKWTAPATENKTPASMPTKPNADNGTGGEFKPRLGMIKKLPDAEGAA